MNATNKSDIWALGGVFLNFITWLLCGWKGVVEFSNKQMEKNNQETQVDTFFMLKDRHGASPELKECVTQWMDKQQSHEKQTKWTGDLLNVIMESMLLINPKTRQPSGALSEKLSVINKKCQKDRRDPNDRDTASVSPRRSVRQYVLSRYSLVDWIVELFKTLFPDYWKPISIRNIPIQWYLKLVYVENVHSTIRFSSAIFIMLNFLGISLSHETGMVGNLKGRCWADTRCDEAGT